MLVARNLGRAEIATPLGDSLLAMTVWLLFGMTIRFQQDESLHSHSDSDLDIESENEYEYD